jgi:hypothetical protein
MNFFEGQRRLLPNRGFSLKQLITQALTEKLMRRNQSILPAWNRAFGAMKDSKRENRRIEQLIEEEFEMPVVSRDRHFDQVPGVSSILW